jgi:hypothetical protein
MTLHRLRHGITEAGLIAAELLEVAITTTICRRRGHAQPLQLQRMSHGAIEVCTRCSATVTPNAELDTP